MERVYYINGLDCANCAAKLERYLNEIEYFDNVVIDFMAQKLIIAYKNEDGLQLGLLEAEKVIAKMEPDVTITSKVKKTKMRTGNLSKAMRQYEATCQEQLNIYGESCNCGSSQVAPQNFGKACNCEENISCESLSPKELTTKTTLKEQKITLKMKKEVTKLIASAVLFVLALLVADTSNMQLGLYLTAYLLVGGEVLLRATKNILRGQIFDENFLMTIATIGAFFVGEYPEGVMVMLLYQMGELFQDYAVQRSRSSISALMDIKPDLVHIKDGDHYRTLSPEVAIVGDIIQVRPGERIPLDGVIVAGYSSINTVALTGETMPRDVKPGDNIMSGCINTSGVLTVRVEKEYEDSTVAKILDLVENASSKKAEAENFITKFARYYTPIVVIVAVALAVVPPMLLHESFRGWIYRALVFLVISCPCALVISIPLTFFSGLGACSHHGILVKGSNYLESLAQIETAVFDKTGTLTQGQFIVTEVHPIFMDDDELLYYAACAESISNHPIADAIRKANRQIFSANAVQGAEEVAGHGVSAKVAGHHVLVGNHRLMERYQIDFDRVDANDTIVYIAIDQVFRGWIHIADTVKLDAKEMITQLKMLGINDIVMLTGDNQSTAEKVAKQLGITKIFSQLLPGDKVLCLEQILSQKKTNTTVAFLGDGLNDAPVLARADIGIAMGGLGSDAAIEAADVVIMNDQPSKIVNAVKIARNTRTIVKQNIVFILTVKLLVLVLGAFGIATMWMAVFADVGVAFLAILNAVRIMR